MLETVIARAGNAAERRAAERTVSLAEAVQAALPPGIEADAVDGGVRLSGRGLRRRFALEPALRWLTGSLR